MNSTFQMFEGNKNVLKSAVISIISNDKKVLVGPPSLPLLLMALVNVEIQRRSLSSST